MLTTFPLADLAIKFLGALFCCEFIISQNLGLNIIDGIPFVKK
jgi:hypothetical protein